MGRPIKISKEEIVELYGILLTTNKVAKALGCSQSYVYNVLKDKGIKMKGRRYNTGPKPKHAPEHVIECFKKLGKVKLVAKALGYPTSSVYGVFRRHGFKVKEYRQSL